MFVCFTLSQGGMVLHWRRNHEPGWRRRMAINAFGAVLTAIVLAIVVFEKFAGGAYLVVILIPLIVGDDAVHQPPVRGVGAAARAPARTSSPSRRRARSGPSSPSRRINRAAVRAVNVARSDQPRR